jgi:hypothetical protein
MPAMVLMEAAEPHEHGLVPRARIGAESMGRLQAITSLVKGPPVRMTDKGYDALIPAGKCIGRHLSQDDKKLCMTRL